MNWLNKVDNQWRKVGAVVIHLDCHLALAYYLD
nr:MAG TPA: hypothetical protein [Caudoviricetes sp.]